ncbi:RNA polymerase sigma factor [Streptomyces lavendulae]|uniref:hypothetical protein n=1 Tax=Streptomyces lavendulae TaxID=1914 RepID=UPI0036910A66
MIDLSATQIADAQRNDLTAVTAVVEATEERVMQLARRYATTGGILNADLMEDLAQVGRIAVWQGLSRFAGSSVAEFFTFMDRTVSGALADERKVQTRPGVSREIAALFESCLTRADGDPYEAERLCTLGDVLGRRKMTPEMAYAARASWQGVDYLDAQQGSNDGDAWSEDLGVTDYDVPQEFVTAADINSARRSATIKKVHETLDRLPGAQEAVLSAEFGIGEFPCFGDDYRALADVAGVPVAGIDSFRESARDAFRTVYLGGSPEADKGEVKCCTTCNLEKPIESFYVRNKATGARMATCSACKKGATKRFRVENSEARNAQKRASRARSKAKVSA